jgi:ketosteroid isomerase-like protein
MAAEDVVNGTYAEEQGRIERRLGEILDAVRQRDLDRLDSYHLYGPKFTKFDDFEPLDRQDAETGRQVEHEGIGSLKRFAGRVVDLKVDVFGPAAVATYVFEYGGTTADDEEFEVRARSTIVFLRDRGEWKIVHEHFSPFKSNP